MGVGNIKMKKGIARITSVTIFSLLAMGVFSPLALATRTPDQHDATINSQIPTTGDLQFDNAVCGLSSAPDLTISYASYILDSAKYNPYLNSTSTINDVKASYQAAINDSTNGTGFVSYGHNNNGEFVRVSWTRDPNAHLEWSSNPSSMYDYQEVDLLSNGTGSGEVTIQCDGSHNFWGIKNAYTGATSSTLTLQGHNFNTTSLLYLYSVGDNFAYNYPSGYTGASMLDKSTDGDNDGLSAAQEEIQGTSDTNPDTDGDGIDDLKESVWYPDRNVIFCGSSECAYPDPVKKDLYVEVDWMKEPGLFGRSFKPSTTQLDYVVDAYAAQDINAHFDTGQYGGGNELPVYTQNLSFYITPTGTDFYDYKYGDSAMSANFESNRYHVWHYLISGYHYTQDTGSSGASYVGDDDSFVSTGLIQDSTSFPHVYDIDHAIAGTILHELGHSLCLSSQQEYTNQPSECIYAGIHTLDNSTYDSYHSVMNYSYQMTDLVNLSSGLATPNDHDDWSAIKDGMKDFTSSDAEGVDPNSQNNRLMLPNTRTLIKRIPHITS